MTPLLGCLQTRLVELSTGVGEFDAGSVLVPSLLPRNRQVVPVHCQLSWRSRLLSCDHDSLRGLRERSTEKSAGARLNSALRETQSLREVHSPSRKSIGVVGMVETTIWILGSASKSKTAKNTCQSQSRVLDFRLRALKVEALIVTQKFEEVSVRSKVQRIERDLTVRGVADKRSYRVLDRVSRLLSTPGVCTAMKVCSKRHQRAQVMRPSQLYIRHTAPCDATLGALRACRRGALSHTQVRAHAQR